MTVEQPHDIMTVEVGEGLPDQEVDLETIRSGLHSDENVVRSHAAKVAAVYATDDPERVLELTPTLLESLEAEHPVVLFQTATAVMHVASVEPDRLREAIPRLVDLLGHDMVEIRKLAARTLAQVGAEHPGYLTDHVERLLIASADAPEELFDSEKFPEFDSNRHDEGALDEVNRDVMIQQELSREYTASLLVEVAEHDPETLTGHVPRLGELLDDTDLGVARPAAAILATVAEHDPGAVAPAVDDVRALLDEDDETLVANAIVALGHVRAGGALDEVRAIANDPDRSDDLQDLAAETADHLARAG